MLVALMIPIFGILVDSPIGRAIARRLEGPEQVIPASMVELARKVELLEAEVDDLTRAVETLKEENQFFRTRNNVSATTKRYSACEIPRA